MGENNEEKLGYGDMTIKSFFLNGGDISRKLTHIPAVRSDTSTVSDQSDEWFLPDV